MYAMEKKSWTEKYKILPGSKVDLKEYDPDSTDSFDSKHDALTQLEENTTLLADLQYKLYAENRQSLLVILQAMDAGGKDGTINSVFAPMNPQGCRVQNFKVPSTLEASHDFLWRIHQAAPKNGEVVIFNRSHYEDVLVARVHNLVPREVWESRYEAINNFEKLLLSNRTTIVKFFLHISKEEQLDRFKARLTDPAKQWKITEADYQERQYWDDYQKAFEAALSHCSTKEAPWYVIPANKKWFRNLAVSTILLETMTQMNLQLPPVTADLEKIRHLYEADEKEQENN